MPSENVTKQALNTYPAWSPRFWHGMAVSSWLRLMLPRLHRVHPLRMPMALIVSGCAVVNSVLSFLQTLIYGRAIARTELNRAPIFILGHWRSGTTYLHELLVLDERLAYPTTYECFAPTHFVLTGRLLPRLLGFSVAREAAERRHDHQLQSSPGGRVCLAGPGRSEPILRLAFPNDPPMHMEMLDMEGVSEPDLARWKRAIFAFIRAQTYLKGKPLVLKSPPHTGRIRVLAEMFPEAKFIHLVRDPDSLFPSTRRLWYALEQVQGFQVPRYEHLDDYVFSAFERMYHGFEQQRPFVDDSRICDVRYEDLVKDPLGEVRRIYEHLGLGNFDQVRDKIAASVNDRKSYRTTSHSLEEPIKSQIRQRWGKYLEKYGYAQEENAAGNS